MVSYAWPSFYHFFYLVPSQQSAWWDSAIGFSQSANIYIGREDLIKHPCDIGGKMCLLLDEWEMRWEDKWDARDERDDGGGGGNHGNVGCSSAIQIRWRKSRVKLLRALSHAIIISPCASVNSFPLLHDILYYISLKISKNMVTPIPLHFTMPTSRKVDDFVCHLLEDELGLSCQPQMWHLLSPAS